MEKRYFESEMELWRQWKAFIFLMALVFVIGLSYVHWNVYKASLSDLVKVVVMGERAFIVRATDGSARANREILIGSLFLKDNPEKISDY